MPIKPIVLQRRHAELGRIRLGNQVPTTAPHPPNKLETFRFTSASERHIRDLANLYGGEARPWDNNGKPEWEVFSEAKDIPVIAVKGGLSQWMETWSGGGCTHRCDGEHQVDGTPCDPNDPGHINAKPTTRLSLMLVELEAIGVFRLESHGWNAAAEIPAVAELAQFVGDLVPARLHLIERRVVKDGQTSRFVVPVLDLQIGTERLKEIVAEKSGLTTLPGGQAPALQSGGAPALPGAPSAPAAGIPNYLDQAQQCSTFEAVAAIRTKAGSAGHLTEQLDAELLIVANALRKPAAPPPGPDADGAYEAEVVHVTDEDAAAEADLAWQRALAAAGKAGLTLDQTTEEFARWSGGEQAQDASAARLDEFTAYLASGQQVPA